MTNKHQKFDAPENFIYLCCNFRNRNKDNKKRGDVEDIHSIEKANSIEDNGMEEENINEEALISICTMLINVVRKLNKSLSGLILNTYFNCLLMSTTTLYASLSIFLNEYRDAEIYLACAAYFSIAVLSIGRLFWLTNSGYNLSVAMKGCAHKLDRFKFKDNTIDANEIQLLRQDLRYYCDSPITPFSAFSLSNGTLIGTCATIVTYLIILIEFKASEIPTNIMQGKNMSDIMNQTINSSNTT